MIKQIIQILGATLLMALLVAACGLLGSDDDKEGEPIQIRISNQTGYDFEWYRFRISLGNRDESDVFEFEFPELRDSEVNEYFHIPVTTDNIIGYSIYMTYYSTYFGPYVMDLSLTTNLNEDRAEPITEGKYTYIAEYTSRDFAYYTITQHQENEEEVRIRVQNVHDVDYEQVSVWLRDDDGMGREFEFGPVAAGRQSSYHTVEGAIQFTITEVVTAAGDTVDNRPNAHFGTELPPGDYTYYVDVLTNRFHDHSRLVKD